MKKAVAYMRDVADTTEGSLERRLVIAQGMIAASREHDRAAMTYFASFGDDSASTQTLMPDDDDAPATTSSKKRSATSASTTQQQKQRSLSLKACPLCDYTAAKTGYVADHVASQHLDEKPYECPACNRATTRRANMVKHMARCHGDDASLEVPTPTYPVLCGPLPAKLPRRLREWIDEYRRHRARFARVDDDNDDDDSEAVLLLTSIKKKKKTTTTTTTTTK